VIGKCLGEPLIGALPAGQDRLSVCDKLFYFFYVRSDTLRTQMGRFRFPPGNILAEIIHHFADAFSHAPRPRAPQLDNATVRELVQKGKSALPARAGDEAGEFDC